MPLSHVPHKYQLYDFLNCILCAAMSVRLGCQNSVAWVGNALQCHATVVYGSAYIPSGWVQCHLNMFLLPAASLSNWVYVLLIKKNLGMRLLSKPYGTVSKQKYWFTFMFDYMYQVYVCIKTIII